MRRIAGVDVGFPRRDGEPVARAAAVLLSVPELETLAEHVHEEPVRFPYVPGLLSFREAPAVAAAVLALPDAPDVVMVDGQGLAHPRRFGIACHLGVLLDLPAIGVAKSILVGKPEGELGEDAGSRVPLVWRGRVVGAVLRTKRRVNPVYVSVGHRVSLEGAVRRVLALTRGYRLPEPTRQAHLAANAYRRAAGEG